jgi:decaprenylphospho-beta-D-erythro-pentofuranosid-2-ulose 2-reductase
VIDALGRPQSVLLLGGTSEIGLACVRALGGGELGRVVLAGRPSARLDAAAQDMKDAGVTDVEVVALDATRTPEHGPALQAVFDAGDVDVVLMAIGDLGDQEAAEADPELAVQTAQATYVGPMSALLHAAFGMRRQGHGVIVVLSSVAAVRARRSNFVYGSAKAGLDSFAQGLGAALAGSGVSVVTVRPGFVRTRMTAGLPAAPFATDAVAVAAAVRDAVRDRPQVVWVPSALRYVMTVLRLLPRPLFRRLPR